VTPLPPLTVFDIETTGLDPKRGHRIVEIAGVRLENGKLVREQTFSSFVNPEREIPFEARQVNKISDDDVRNAPTIDAVLPDFLQFASGSLLVAHNANFDFSFLENEKEYCWGYVDLPECLCTMRLSQALYPQEFRHSLDVLCRRYQLTMPTDRHRALSDAILAAEALQKMLELGRCRGMEDLRKMAGLKNLVK
jgi:DNA polymerase-3 subunit epsilon